MFPAFSFFFSYKDGFILVSDALQGNVCGHTFLIYVNYCALFHDFPCSCDGRTDDLPYLCSVI